MQSTKQATPQFDYAMTEYLKYAAAIRYLTAEKFLASTARKFDRLHPSLKRIQTLQRFTHDSIINTIEEYEESINLPRSTTFSNRPSDAHQCWENMLWNRYTADGWALQKWAVGCPCSRHRPEVQGTSVSLSPTN